MQHSVDFLKLSEISCNALDFGRKSSEYSSDLKGSVISTNSLRHCYFERFKLFLTLNQPKLTRRVINYAVTLFENIFLKDLYVSTRTQKHGNFAVCRVSDLVFLYIKDYALGKICLGFD